METDCVIRWWFVVRGSEETIQQLESGWPKVQLQTAWKLEPLYFTSMKKMPNKSYQCQQINYYLKNLNLLKSATLPSSFLARQVLQINTPIFQL